MLLNKQYKENNYRNTVLKEKLQSVLFSTTEHYKVCSQILMSDILQLRLRPAPKIESNLRNLLVQKLAYKHR